MDEDDPRTQSNAFEAGPSFMSFEEVEEEDPTLKNTEIKMNDRHAKAFGMDGVSTDSCSKFERLLVEIIQEKTAMLTDLCSQI